MKLQELAIALMICVVVIMSFTGFAIDLSANYPMNVSTALQEEANSTLQRLGDASESITESIRSEQGWLETAFTLLFKSNVVLDALFGTLGMTRTFFGVIVDESAIPFPEWVMPVVIVIIGLVIIFTLLAIVLKREKV